MGESLCPKAESCIVLEARLRYGRDLTTMVLLVWVGVQVMLVVKIGESFRGKWLFCWVDRLGVV
jgi:hypothetical protein